MATNHYFYESTTCRFALSLLLFSSCGNTHYFATAQPQGVADETAFDSTLIGRYDLRKLMGYDTSKRDYTMYINRYLVYLDKDTVFQISVNNSLRLYRGLYFLSLRDKDDSLRRYEVYYIRPVHGGIKLGAINNAKMKELTPKVFAQNHFDILTRIEINTDSLGIYHSDTTKQYTLNPNKEELMLFVKKGGFDESIRLKRLE